MKKSIQILLNEASQKMNGYVIYMNYQFVHFSVKAEPAALLSVSVEIEQDVYDIEEVADVAIPQDDMFVILPKQGSFLFPLCKAISLAHPEYKLERKKSTEDSENEDVNENANEDVDNNDDIIIQCSMPVVNDDRKDAGMDYVKMLFDEISSKLEVVHASYLEKITSKLTGANVKELDEATKQLDEFYDQYKKLGQEYRDIKEKQIEEAYQKYLSEQKEKEAVEREIKEAKGEDAAKSVFLDSFAKFEEE